MSEHVNASPPLAAAPAVVETNREPHPATPPILEIKRHVRRLWVWLLVGLLVLTALGYYFTPSVVLAFTTISTDDAYVNGHVTFVAPRVAGKVLGGNAAGRCAGRPAAFP